ncbi:MAG: MarR family transcriptional regulator [Rhodocyclaceae bacterium]|nr:MAG: MarR family transcriptional regulator [Rhodocyclaceae bacterium]
MSRKTNVKVGTLEEFFDEGRRVARLADTGRPIPETSSITFGSVEDLLEYLTPKRIALFEAIKMAVEPTSISAMALQVGRDRAAVKRDIDALQRLGIVDIDEAPLPGHGRQKLVRPVARTVVLTATL